MKKDSGLSEVLCQLPGQPLLGSPGQVPSLCREDFWCTQGFLPAPELCRAWGAACTTCSSTAHPSLLCAAPASTAVVFSFFFLIAGRLGLEAKVPQALREGDTRILQRVLLQPHCQRPWPRGDPTRHLGCGVMLRHSPAVAAPVPLRLGRGRAGQVTLFPAIATHSHLLHTRCTPGLPDELLLAPKIQVGRLRHAPNNQAETIPPAAHCRWKGRWMVLQPRAPPAPGDTGAPFLAP